MIIDDADDEAERVGEGKSRLPEGLRKALVTGLSAVFMTEEGIRSAMTDMRLPKEAIAFLSAQTDRTRRELFRIVSEELKGFLKGVDLQGALRKALVGLRVEVKAELRFVEDAAGGVRAEVTTLDAEPSVAPRVEGPRRKRAPKKRPPEESES